MPRTYRVRVFCEEYIRDFNITQAALRAGYTEKYAGHRCHEIVRKYADYIKWLQAHVAVESAERIAIDQEQVLRRLARIAFANEYDYLVIEEVQTPDGEVVRRARRKELHELTRDQMEAIRVKRVGDDLDYELLDVEGQLVNLGKHLGLFNDKLIFEHRHKHLHANIDLTGVSEDRLVALEAQFAELLAGDEQGRRLLEAQ